MKRIIILFFNITLIVFISSLSADFSYAQEHADDLNARPDSDGTPTSVKMTIMVLDIDAISGANQTFTSNIVVIAEWKDSRLAGRTSRTKISLNKIWDPQLQIVNQQRLLKTLPDTAEIEPDGTVRTVQRYWGVFSNPLDLRDFPLDQHEFSIQILAAAGEMNEIEMTISDDKKLPTGLSEKLSLPDWEIIDWHTSNAPIVLIKGMDGLPGISFIFQARRHVGYYITKVLLPLFMILMMSWIVFWIHPSEAGSQISVSVTSMLTLIAYRFAIGSNLPHVSYLTKMDTFILFSTVLVFLALLEVVLTSSLSKSGKVELALTIDRVCRVLFPSLFVLGFVISVVT